MKTLSEVLETFLKEDRSPATHRNYHSLLSRMALAIGPARQIGRITYDDLLDFTNSLKAELSAASLHQYVIVMKTFFNWVVRHKYLDDSPADGLVVRLPPDDVTVSRAIPRDLLQAMLERSRYDRRDHALLLFLADTGGRRGAAASLQIGNLHLAEGRALVKEKGSKRCWVYFGEQTALALSCWLEKRPQVAHDYVFTRTGAGAPLSPDGISAVVRRLSKECGGRSYGPHAIRHWLAESWVEAGAAPNDVQHKLNHRRVETTLRRYYPRYSRNVEVLSRKLSLNQLQVEPASKPDNIIPLDDCG